MSLPCYANETNGGESPAYASFRAFLFPPFSKISLKVISLLVLVCCNLGLSATTHAQSTAAIEGQVVDPNGAAVPAVQIVATNAETSTTRRTVTDESGRYQLVALPLGTYRVECTGVGFQKQVIE